MFTPASVPGLSRLEALLEADISKSQVLQVGGTLYESQNKNVEPLFYVDGPAKEIPNVQYAELLDEANRIADQIIAIENILSSNKLLDAEWSGMEKRIQEGTVTDRSNIVIFARFYPLLLADPGLEEVVKRFWVPLFDNTQNTTYDLIKIRAQDSPEFRRWRVANRTRLNMMFANLKYISLPPTEELARHLLENYMRDIDRIDSVLHYLDILRTPKMWVWGQILANLNNDADIFWTSRFEAWARGSPGAPTVAAFYKLIDDNTGNILKEYSRATSPAAKTAIVNRGLPAAGLLLSGVPREKWNETLENALSSLAGLSLNSPNIYTVIAAMQMVQNEFKHIAFAPNSERAFFLQKTGEFLDRLRGVIGSESAVVGGVLRSTISAVNLSRVDANQIFSTPTVLLNNSYVLNKLATMIEDDADISIGTFGAIGINDKMIERDEIHEWFLTRTAWIRNVDLAQSDARLPLFVKRFELNVLRNKLAKISPVVKIPLVLRQMGTYDDLRGKQIRLEATIIDKRPVSGGPGGYAFGPTREYRVEWVRTRMVPNPMLVTYGELTDRQGANKFNYERVIMGSEIVRGYGQKTVIRSPVLLSVASYAAGEMWCVVTSVDTLGNVAVVTSPAVYFESKQYCVRCMDYFSVKDEQFANCEWKDPETGICYRGKCTEHGKLPTPYDAITGVRGSVPIGDGIPYNFEEIYKYVEARAQKFIQIHPITFAEEINLARQNLIKYVGKNPEAEADVIVALENMIRFLQRNPYVSDPNINLTMFTPEKLVNEWLNQLYSHKRGPFAVHV